MSVPRARASQRGDTAITVTKDEEGTETAVAGASNAVSEPAGAAAVTIEEQQRPIRPYAAFRRSAGYRRTVVDEDDQEQAKPRRSFCRSWCEIWFLVAQSRISCSIFTAILFITGTVIILITSLGGVSDCQPLTGATVVCFMFAILGFTLACLCCCYHWVRDDEDLPFAIFCTAYCLLLIFIFTVAAGSTAIYTHLDVIFDGKYTHDGKTVSCEMTAWPVVVMGLSYIVGLGFVFMSFVAFVIGMGISS